MCLCPSITPLIRSQDSKPCDWGKLSRQHCDSTMLNEGSMKAETYRIKGKSILALIQGAA